MPLHEFFQRPEVKKLVARWFRRPREGSSVERTVNALCADRAVAFDKHGNFVGLPTNKELSEMLGITEATVRQHIEVAAARSIDGLEEIPARYRVYFAEMWREPLKWLEEHQTPPKGSRVA